MEEYGRGYRAGVLDLSDAVKRTMSSIDDQNLIDKLAQRLIAKTKNDLWRLQHKEGKSTIRGAKCGHM